MGLAHKDVPIKNSDRMNHQARGHLAVGINGFTSDTVTILVECIVDLPSVIQKCTVHIIILHTLHI